MYRKQLYSLPFLLLCGLVLAFSTANAQSSKRPDFSDYYELEPFQVTGEEIPITVFARNSGDRRYAARLAHKVVEVAYLTIESSPGSGLVIMGKSGEPHPLFIFERFLERSKAEDAPPEMKRLGEELDKTLNAWEEKIHFEDEGGDEEMPFEMETVIPAFPIPLNGIAAELYLLAWQEEFDTKRVDQRLSSLSVEDLEASQFSEFNWIFYLPPKNALNKALKEILPAAMKAEKMGFMKRMLIRGAVATFKPLIRDAMEGLRKGVLYWSVLDSTEQFEKEDLDLLAQSYIESQMPKGKIIPGNKQERGIEAVMAQKKENEEYARDPFVVPELLEEYQVSNYTRFTGEYGAANHRSKRFFVDDKTFYWQEGDDEPIAFQPASDLLLVSEKNDITIEFSRDEFGQYSSVELRKGRGRWTFQKFPNVPLD